jgi:predicted amidohydrolase
MVEAGAQEQTVTVTIDADSLAAHRTRFPAWMDADTFRFDS